MTWRVIVGTLSFVITMILFGFVAVTEQDRMANFSVAYEARNVEAGGQLFESSCAPCHGLDGKGTGRAPALNTADLLAQPAGGGQPPRLAAAGWGGSIPDYIHATIAGGRPQASAQFSQFPERMPTWSSEFGGPMRDDQIQALVAYIMNWGQAYANATPVPVPTVVPVGTDITVELPAGDAASGQALATTLGCVACHISQGAATLGPDWMASGDPNGEGIGTRAEKRPDAADYAGAATTGDQYLFESIVAPDAYIVPGNATYVNASNGQSIMPHNYATVLDAQMVADVIAYLQTLK